MSSLDMPPEAEANAYLMEYLWGLFECVRLADGELKNMGWTLSCKVAISKGEDHEP